MSFYEGPGSIFPQSAQNLWDLTVNSVQLVTNNITMDSQLLTEMSYDTEAYDLIAYAPDQPQDPSLSPLLIPPNESQTDASRSIGSSISSSQDDGKWYHDAGQSTIQQTEPNRSTTLDCGEAEHRNPDTRLSDVQKRREYNRLSARKSRKRARTHTADLQAQTEELGQQQAQLLQLKAHLQRQILTLQDYCICHSSCESFGLCTSNRQNNKTNAR